jgi:hypothetical protein
MLEDLQKMGRKRLGGILMSEGLVTPEQVTEALEIQKDTGKMLGEVLVQLGYITEYNLAKSLATQFQFPYINPASYQVDRAILEMLPVEMYYKYIFIPLDRFGNLIIVAMAGLLPEDVVHDIKKRTGCDLRIYISTAQDVRAVLERELPIDAKLRKEIEGPSIAPIAAKVKKRSAAKKAGAKEKPAAKKAAAKKTAAKKPAAKKEPVPAAEPSGLDIFDEADALVAAERTTSSKPKPKPKPEPEPEDISADIGVIESDDGDVDWQGLFDEVDKSIRDEIKKKKEVTVEGEAVDYDYDFD